MSESNKEEVIAALTQLLENVHNGRKMYQELNDYGKMNQVAWLGELFIASDLRASKWDAVLTKAIELIEENDKSTSDTAS